MGLNHTHIYATLVHLNTPMNPDVLQGEIQRLGSLLEMERARRFGDDQKLARLEAELEETEFQSQRDVHQGKKIEGTRERVTKFSEQRAKQDLHQIDKLRAKKDRLIEEMSKEFQTLQEKVSGLTKHLKRSQSLQQKVEQHQLQITLEKKAHLEKSKENMVLLYASRAMNAATQENMSTEIKLLQEKEKGPQVELERIKALYQELSCRYETNVAALKERAEKCQQQMSCEKNVYLERANEDLQLANTLRAEKQKNVAGNLSVARDGGRSKEKEHWQICA